MSSICQGTTLEGNPCQSPPSINSEYCHHHDPSKKKCGAMTIHKTACKKIAKNNGRCHLHAPLDKQEQDIIDKYGPVKHKELTDATWKCLVWNMWIGFKTSTLCPLCPIFRPGKDVRRIYKDEFSLAHVVAKSRYKVQCIENLRACCSDCNPKQGTKVVNPSKFVYKN